jgi:hypothetical protein
MSKIIVDQIAKNGGTTFTLPSTDGGANAPLVTNGTGTLAYSPLKMPAADGTANKPITTDGSGQLQFNPNALPAAAGTAGQFLVSGGTGASTWGNATGGSFFKCYDFLATSAANITVNYSDIESSLTKDNVAGLTLHFYGVSSSAECYFNIRGLNSSSSPITTGYYGWSYMGRHGNGGAIQGDSHNSNDGRFWFPLYTTQSHSGYSYGSGLTGTISLYHGPEDSSVYRSPEMTYTIQYQQQTSYNGSNIEFGGYNSRATQQDSPEWTNGIYVYTSNGSFEKGRLVIEAHKR